MLQEELGKRIQNLRKEKGLSQEKFALTIGMEEGPCGGRAGRLR